MEQVSYTATVEVDQRVDVHQVDPDDFDDVVDQLGIHDVAVTVSSRGWLTATITLTAGSIARATLSAIGLVEAATGRRAIAVEVMTDAERDAREGWVPIPELMSVTEVAQALGVSRQAVLDRVARRTLQATKVGRDYIIPRTALKTSASG